MRVRSNLKHTHTDETTNEHIHTNTATTSASNVRAHFGKQFVSTVRLLIDPSGRQPGRAADCNTFNRDEHLSHVKHLSLHTNTVAPTRTLNSKLLPPCTSQSSTIHMQTGPGSFVAPVCVKSSLISVRLLPISTNTPKTTAPANQAPANTSLTYAQTIFFLPSHEICS